MLLRPLLINGIPSITSVELRTKNQKYEKLFSIFRS